MRGSIFVDVRVKPRYPWYCLDLAEAKALGEHFDRASPNEINLVLHGGKRCPSVGAKFVRLNGTDRREDALKFKSNLLLSRRPNRS